MTNFLSLALEALSVLIGAATLYFTLTSRRKT